MTGVKRRRRPLGSRARARPCTRTRVHSKANAADAIAAWVSFLEKARLKRLDPGEFAAFLPLHFAKHPLPSIVIADLLLRPTELHHFYIDIRFTLYLKVLLQQNRVNTPTVLRALYKYSSAHLRVRPQDADPLPGDGIKKEDGQDAPKRQRIHHWDNSYTEEEMILWRLAQRVHKRQDVKTDGTIVQIAKVVTKWMILLAEAAAAFSRDAFGSLQGLQARDETEDVRNAFVLFLIAFTEHIQVRITLMKPPQKDVAKKLSDALQTFLPCVMQTLPELAAQLEAFRTSALSIHFSSEKKEAAEVNTYMDSLIGLDNVQVPEVPIVNSRAGLYIYLSAALVGRPMIDDATLFTYLNNRYQGDIQLTAVQFILASFDLLANAVFRNEGPKTGHLLKSYVVNKVPLVLVALATSTMYQFNAELCITEALGQVDTNIFPTLSGMFEMTNTSSSFHDSVRQDFCFSCQLHGLLSPAATENLLGDITYQSLPDEGRYVKEDLVQACLHDVDRTQKLIGELDNMNGNVGAAAQAIVEVIGSLCRNKETMTLKQICSQLAAKPLSLDVILLFDKPQKILHPLCELLDNWTGYEEDQGEYQPVYEEFGSILLLLLAFAYRYGLSSADLGIRSPDSFVGKLLGVGALCRPMEDLNEQEKSHLHGWIHGLFDSSGGLGDELMASCPPQDFYLLAPTLFQQLVGALSTGLLTDDMLKGGLEYLVDVLLLPSLVPAILFLSNQLVVGPPMQLPNNQIQTPLIPLQTSIIKILQAILRPSSISHEASTMLSSVLNIVAKPLEHALRSYQRQEPKSQEVEPLLRAIKENLSLSRRTGGADHTELEAWSSTHNSNSGNSSTNTAVTAVNTTNPTGAGANNNAHPGLSAAVRHTVQTLIQWAQHPPINGMPATYTHRQTLAADKMLGSRRLLSILLEELKAAADTPQASIAYDVATAIICAPDVTNDQSLALAGATAAAAAAAAAAGSASAATSLPEDAPRQRHASLRDALKAEAEDWRRVQRTDAVLAEAAVRLHRRVEAQMAPPPPEAEVDAASAAAAAAAAAAAMLQPELGGLGGDAGLGEAIAAAAAVAGGEDVMALDGGLDGSDLGGLGDADDLGGDGIFGGLTGGDGFVTDFGSWDMDLG